MMRTVVLALAVLVATASAGLSTEAHSSLPAVEADIRVGDDCERQQE